MKFKARVLITALLSLPVVFVAMAQDKWVVSYLQANDREFTTTIIGGADDTTFAFDLYPNSSIQVEIISSTDTVNAQFELLTSYSYFDSLFQAVQTITTLTDSGTSDILPLFFAAAPLGKIVTTGLTYDDTLVLKIRRCGHTTQAGARGR